MCSDTDVEVHQVRKLADLTRPGRPQPAWATAHGPNAQEDPRGLHPLPRRHPRYNLTAARHSHWRATCSETGPRGSDRGPVEKGLAYDRHLATGPPVLLRSWSNTLISVRRVTQRNAGRKTAGIDGQVALTSQARMELAVQVHRHASSWRPPAGPAGVHTEGGKPCEAPPARDPCDRGPLPSGRVRAALEPEWL